MEHIHKNHKENHSMKHMQIKTSCRSGALQENLGCFANIKLQLLSYNSAMYCTCLYERNCSSMACQPEFFYRTTDLQLNRIKSIKEIWSLWFWHWPGLADLCVGGLSGHVAVVPSRTQYTIPHSLHTGHVTERSCGAGVLAGVPGAGRAVVTWND